MNANLYNTRDYDIFLPLAGQKNKPNSNPIKANLKRAKINVNLYFIEDYRKKDDFVVRINKPNFQNTHFFIISLLHFHHIPGPDML